MKRTIMKITAAVTACIMSAACLAGCYKNTGTGDDAVAVTMAGKDYTVGEAKLYVYVNQYETEVENEFYVAYLYGSYDTFWDSYADSAKTQAIQQLVQTKMLVQEADAEGVTLDEDEETKVTDEIPSFEETYAAAIEKAGASEELVSQYVRENAIANKMYVVLTADVDTNIEPDDETMRRKSGEGLSVTANTSYEETVTEDDPDTDEDESETETVDISADDQVTNREEAVADITERLNNGETASDIADAYTDSDLVTVSDLGDISASSEDVPDEEGTYTEYAQLLWTMSTGDVASCDIVNSSDETVSYVLSCTDDDDAELRAEAEKDEIQNRKDTAFNEAFAKIAKKISYHVYESSLENVKITDALYESAYMSSTDDTDTSDSGIEIIDDTTEEETETESGSGTETETETDSTTEDTSKAE